MGSCCSVTRTSGGHQPVGSDPPTLDSDQRTLDSDSRTREPAPGPPAGRPPADGSGSSPRPERESVSRPPTALRWSHDATDPTPAPAAAAEQEVTESLSMPYPQLQQPAPFFRSQAAISGEFKEICLDDYLGKYLVLVFYPLDFTFVCPTEIVAFSDAATKFRDINCEVIACSTDSHFCHMAWINTPRKEGGLGPMNIPLLSDKTMVISRAYGVLKEDVGYPFRGLFIIDTKGILRQIVVNDIGVGRSVDEVMRLVQAYQFVDVHGEVCPVGWKPGDVGVKPNTDDSKVYFSISHK